METVAVYAECMITMDSVCCSERRCHMPHNSSGYGFTAKEMCRPCNFSSWWCQLATKIVWFDTAELFFCAAMQTTVFTFEQFTTIILQFMAEMPKSGRKYMRLEASILPLCMDEFETHQITKALQWKINVGACPGVSGRIARTMGRRLSPPNWYPLRLKADITSSECVLSITSWLCAVQEVWLTRAEPKRLYKWEQIWYWMVGWERGSIVEPWYPSQWMNASSQSASKRKTSTRGRYIQVHVLWALILPQFHNCGKRF